MPEIATSARTAGAWRDTGRMRDPCAARVRGAGAGMRPADTIDSLNLL